MIMAKEKNKGDVEIRSYVNKDGSTTHEHRIGDTTYIISSNFIPTEQNKKALIKTIQHMIQHIMKNAKLSDAEKFMDDDF